MRSLASLACCSLALAVPATAGNVFLVKRPDGGLKIVNVPGPSVAFRVPSGGWRRGTLWPLVERVAKTYGLDPHLVDLVIRVESGYDPKAVSPKGAKGVMQLMPHTAALYGVENLFDVEDNLRGGVRYLRDLLERFGFDLGKALAAYNAGPKAVERHGGVPPYPETQRYVSSILSAYQGGRGAPVLTGGFGVPAKSSRPVRVVETPHQRLLTNSQRRGEAPVGRRLALQ